MNLVKVFLVLVLLPQLVWAQIQLLEEQRSNNIPAFADLNNQNQPSPMPQQKEEKQERNSDIVETDLNTLIRGVLDEKFKYLEHNELRDVMKHDSNLAGTSRHILMDIESNPSKYAGADVGFFLDKGNGITAIGPVGHLSQQASNGKKIYKVDDPRLERRKDAILSVSYERVLDITGEDKVFDIQLLLFIHSSQKGGYYFRKVNVQTNWNSKVSVSTYEGIVEIAKTSLVEVLDEVPLSDTDFELRVELASQKVVLFDRKHKITKVLPVTAGALDIRTNGIDQNNTINSMTLLLPGRSGSYKNFNFNESAIYKRNAWQSHYNQESRNEPSYYKGRPFIGIVDQSRVKAEDGLDTGYRGIGFHYQIDDGGLKRGFESHGCLRLQDHDLYVLDAILNGGPKDSIPVEVRMKLEKFEDLDSVYKRESTYNKVVYSKRPQSPRTVKCPNKPSYPVRFFDNSYHTVADSDCLTKVSDGGESLDSAVSYLLGGLAQPPQPLIWADSNHHPVQVVLDEIKSPKYSHILGRTIMQTFPNSNKWIGDLNQDELNTLLVQLERTLEYENNWGNNTRYSQQQGSQNSSGGGLLGDIFGGNTQRGAQQQPVRISTYPATMTCPRNSHPNTNTNLRRYLQNCAGKAQNATSQTPSQLRPRIQNCNAFYNALVNVNCR